MLRAAKYSKTAKYSKASGGMERIECVDQGGVLFVFEMGGTEEVGRLCGILKERMDMAKEEGKKAKEKEAKGEGKGNG